MPAPKRRTVENRENPSSGTMGVLRVANDNGGLANNLLETTKGISHKNGRPDRSHHYLQNIKPSRWQKLHPRDTRLEENQITRLEVSHHCHPPSGSTSEAGKDITPGQKILQTHEQKL
jgi:hypothetical protein